MFHLNQVKYRDILYIDNLHIDSNCITCILGKSGGGKTTLLKLLNNMLTPDSGLITYRGKDLNTYNPVFLRRSIPMLPQNPVVFPGSIRDNFRLVEEYTEKPPAPDSRYLDLLKMVGLNYKPGENASNLSGGEKQRLALARIMLLKPDTLLLDEPSSALDSETERFIISMVVDYIKARKGTLVMVTHSSLIANKFAEKTIVVNEGTVEKVIER
ncbi:ABC transporter ATP-binding protein [Halothermothrix orenii]|uniref:ABC transporter related n=1 Tax=Halothermothrix orenii (strain H 168 / OCM 544 / DSM 9562) TaxID=373903 RepID=B8CYE2_HALOH|nr:ATP-binding cassette domain-containing protein [Halothermothrix orenii]ACL70311.1 ABC transporter related [Halothermothrix orenii H 168]